MWYTVLHKLTFIGVILINLQYVLLILQITKLTGYVNALSIL